MGGNGGSEGAAMTGSAAKDAFGLSRKAADQAAGPQEPDRLLQLSVFPALSDSYARASAVSTDLH